jgi:D-sedoheptulose 7-phosphate isomerase
MMFLADRPQRIDPVHDPETHIVGRQIANFPKMELQKAVATLNAIAADEALQQLVVDVAAACVTSLRKGGKILFAGNGGSAADAQHLAAELVNRFNFDRPGLAAFALTTDSSVITSIGNDFGYEKVFARQINACGREGDVFFGISTSGQSANILRGIEEARRQRLITVGMTGETGGSMRELCDFCICVPSNETPRIQEGQMVLGHIICGMVEHEMFPRQP